MIRIAYILFIYSGVLLFNFLGDEVTTKMNVADEVEGGKEFVVTVSVDKGRISSFSRFQAELPAGMIAKPGNTSTGEFKFQDKKVKIVWLRLPAEDNVSFSYTVKVDKRLKGSFSLGGVFSYIDNNQRKNVSIAPRQIRILPSTEIEHSQLIDVNDFERLTVPNFMCTSAEVSCIRQKPERVQGKDEIIVNILVHKSDREKFAKIEEQIPSGYIAENIDNKSGIFIFKNQMVKYLWMNLPPEDFFVVSYKLIPKPEVSGKNVAITGSFSYIEGEQTKSISIVQKDVDVRKITAMNINELLMASASSDHDMQSGKKTTAIVFEKETTPEIDIVKETKMETVKAPVDEIQPVVEELPEALPVEVKKPQASEVPKNVKAPEVPVSEKKATPPVRPKSATKSFILEPEEGIYYRVQIAAGHKPVAIKKYFTRYNLDKEVKRESHEGWYKYSVGSFKVYVEARDYRDRLWNTTTIKDAFVTAYNDGQRITVQEALMISNQQWYK